MTDYSELIDREINQLVAKTLGYTEFGFGYVDGYDGEYPYMSKPGSEYREHLPAYCSDISRSWGFILHNDLGLRKQKDGRWCVTRPGGFYPQYDRNPLRAAMIVYLEMFKENQNK